MEKIQVLHRGFSTDVKANSNLNKSCCLGIPQASRSKFHFETVSGQKEWRRNQANLRSSQFQQVYEGKNFSIGLSFQGTRVPTARGLDGTRRLNPDLLPHTSHQESPCLSSPGVRWQASADGLLANGSGICPVAFRHNFELDCENPSKLGDPSPRVHKRFLPGGSGQIQIKATGSAGSQSPHFSGIRFESDKKCLRAPTGVGIPRCSMEYKIGSDGTARQQVQKDCKFSAYSARGGQLYTKASTNYAGAYELRQLCGSKRKTELPPVTGIFSPIPTESNEGETANYPEGKRRIDMVEHSYCRVVSSPQKTSHSLPNHGCIRLGLGSPDERSLHVGRMDERRGGLAFQPEGNVCSIRGNQGESSRTQGCSRDATDRQQDSSIHSSRRRDQFSGSAELNLQVTPPGGRIEDDSISLLSPRSVQRDSRQSIQRKGTPRMAHSARGLQKDFPEVRNARRRFIRVLRVGSGRAIRHAGLQRSLRSIHRRLQSLMELQPRLGVSSTEFNSKSAGTPQPVRGEVSTNSPEWTQTFWRVDLNKRSLESPWTIPRLEEVLIDLATGLPPPQIDRLKLQVWVVGGGRISC